MLTGILGLLDVPHGLFVPLHWYVSYLQGWFRRTGVHDYFLRTDVYGSNIGLTDKTALEVPDDQVSVLREGSIDAFIAWLSYIFMAWSFKGVLIFLYNKMTYVFASKHKMRHEVDSLNIGWVSGNIGCQ